MIHFDWMIFLRPGILLNNSVKSGGKAKIKVRGFHLIFKGKEGKHQTRNGVSIGLFCFRYSVFYLFFFLDCLPDYEMSDLGRVCWKMGGHKSIDVYLEREDMAWLLI